MRFLLRTMLTRFDGIDADIDLVQATIDEQMAPFAKTVTRLDEIPGIGVVTAQVIMAEVGVDKTRFPTPDHLVSWAGVTPGISESAGRRRVAAEPDTATAISAAPWVRSPSAVGAPNVPR